MDSAFSTKRSSSFVGLRRSIQTEADEMGADPSRFISTPSMASYTVSIGGLRLSQRGIARTSVRVASAQSFPQGQWYQAPVEFGGRGTKWARQGHKSATKPASATA